VQYGVFMEQQLKQRLIGAVVLVSLAVIFIPVILEGPDDEWVPRAHDIPAPPQLDYRASMDLQLPAAEPVEPAGPGPATPVAEPPPQPENPPAADTAPVQPVAPAESAPRVENKPPVESKPPVEAQTPAPAAPVAVVPAPGTQAPAPGWYAQLGSFSQQGNAASLRDNLKKAGFAVQIQLVDTAKGSSYRVLAGPVADRGRAESLLRKAGEKMKTTGIVIEIGAGG
jgi:DedD protein